MNKRIVLAGAAALMSWSLSAVTTPVGHEYTFTPNPSDLSDLAHQSLYTWGLKWELPNGEHITGATLTIKNINNWDANKNILHLDLLNSAVPAITWHSNLTVQVAKTNITVKKYYDNKGRLKNTETIRGTGTLQEITSSYTKDVDPGAASAYEGTDHGVVKTYQDNTGDDEWQDEVVDPANPLELNSKTVKSNTAVLTKEDSTTATSPWVYGTGKTGTVETTTYTEVRTKNAFSKTTFESYAWPGAIELADYSDTNGTRVTDNYIYAFTKEQVDALIGFLADGGNVGVAFDPDCHFYNDGVKLVITTGVPDGGITAMLLGFALAGLESFRRRIRARS